MRGTWSADVNMAFAAGADGLTVGLGAPTHVKSPAFDPKLPGSWLVDLSHVDLFKVKAGKQWVAGRLAVALLVHAAGRAPRRPGLVRDTHRRLGGGTRLRGNPDRGVGPPRQRRYQWRY